jgi:hypothetical protein
MTRSPAAASLLFAMGLLGVASEWAWAQGTPSHQEASSPTFSRDVAPILYKHCTTCHRPGEAAPMSLLTFEEVRPWARAIRERVQSGAMPPWHADPAHGKFQNDRRLSADEKDTIARWVTAGAPAGDPAHPPAQPTYAEGWTIGVPDAIVSMPAPYDVAAQGEIPYQYFEASTNFTEDRWVQALEIRPGDRSVVHHVLVYARHPEMTSRTPVFRAKNPPGPMSPRMKHQLAEAMARGGQPTEAQQATRRGPLMAQTAPGTPATVFKPGSALLVKAGTVLTFQIHYTTNGKPTSDRTRVGFVFAKQPPAAEVRAAAMINARFMIPAGASDHPVESALEFLEDVTIYSLVPHTHLRGKRWEHRLVYPDGREEILLAVPTYDFNWQTEYIFAEPLKVPKGAILKAVAHYDNSTGNKANPDPTQAVYWGDQTWEEMQYTAISYSVDKDSRTTVAQPQRQ